MPRLIPIYIIDINSLGAYYENRGIDCYFGKYEGPYIGFDSNYIPQTGNIFDTLIHEYFHHINQYSFENKREWKELFIAADRNLENDCVFQAIRDSNISGHLDRAGHPWDNENEFFASFGVAYFQHHERLLSLIRSLPEGSNCRNILEYAWQFFAEKIAKTPPAENPGSTAGNNIRLYANDDELFGPIVGGRLGNTIYTASQIEKGLWKQSVYDQAPAGEKIKIQLTRTISAISAKLNINPTRFRNQISVLVARFNNLADRLLFFQDKGNLEGRVFEHLDTLRSERPKKDAIVIIGRKMAVTDSEGRFTINGVKAGSQNVRIIDSQTMIDLSVNPESIYIQKVYYSQT